jgi:hypothetical protein
MDPGFSLAWRALVARLNPLILIGVVGLLACGFTLTTKYQERVRDDVAACAIYAKEESPSFDAVVFRIEPTTGEIRLRVTGDPRGEFTFIKCLMTIRNWTWVGQTPRGLHPPL